MKIVGLAGESGTGKTTIAQHLARSGGVHIDGDRVGHELLQSDAGVINAVRDLAGDDVFDADGKIDRQRLGAAVFADPDMLARYNAIIHPAIRRRCGELVDAARSGGAALAVVDAALLLDSGMPFEFDLMIALRASRDVQMRRLVARGDRTGEEARARLDRQQHIEKSFYKADVVVDTDGDLPEVLAEIDGHIARLLNDRT
jgi:dephospho-CoA kinase